MSPTWVSVALLILWCTPVLGTRHIYNFPEDEESSEERSLTCMCTTSQCRHNSYCITQYKCYFEQLTTKDGNNEMKWGCISSSNSLLCENLMPRKSFVYCCDDKDLCNLKNMTDNLPMWMQLHKGGKQSRDTSVPIDGYSSNVKPESNSKILSTTNNNPVMKNFTFFGNGTLFKDSSSCTIFSTTVVQMMLIVSLLIMICIFGFGVYVLKTHSNFSMRYITRSEFLSAHRHCIVRSEAKNVCITTPASVSVIPSQQRTTTASETNSEEESSQDKTSPVSKFVISPIVPLITTPIPSLVPTTAASPRYAIERRNAPASVTVEMPEPLKD